MKYSIGCYCVMFYDSRALFSIKNRFKKNSFRVNNQSSKIKMSGNTGFSLIEIMIVVLIIGISASMAVLYIDNSDDRLKFESKRLLAMTQLARDDAIISGKSLAMTINTDTIHDTDQYYFSQLENGKWIQFSEKPYRTITLSNDIKLRSILSAKLTAKQADSNIKTLENKDLIYFLPTGETSEFQIWISNNNTEYVLSSTIFGELSLKRTENL